MDYDIDETEDLDLMEIRMGENKVGMAGIAKESGIVYMGGDIHPLGSFAALMRACKQHIPYVYTSAVSVLFPADWLRAECLHDPDRLRVISNLENFIRGQ